MNADGTARRWSGRTATFVAHFVEMSVVMLVGMVVLGIPVSLMASAVGYPGGLRPAFPELSVTIMTVQMVLPMAVWMWVRGHGSGTIAEMTIAMAVPTIVCVPLCLTHMISVQAMSTIANVGMFVAMLLMMLYRRDEFTRSHHQFWSGLSRDRLMSKASEETMS